MNPAFGNGLKGPKALLASKKFRDALNIIRKKKMLNPKLSVSQEIEDLLKQGLPDHK